MCLGHIYKSIETFEIYLGFTRIIGDSNNAIVNLTLVSTTRVQIWAKVGYRMFNRKSWPFINLTRFSFNEIYVNYLKK